MLTGLRLEELMPAADVLANEIVKIIIAQGIF